MLHYLVFFMVVLIWVVINYIIINIALEWIKGRFSPKRANLIIYCLIPIYLLMASYALDRIMNVIIPDHNVEQISTKTSTYGTRAYPAGIRHD